jgi:hypothetical protein
MYSRHNKLRLKRQEANTQGDSSWHLIILEIHRTPTFNFSGGLVRVRVDPIMTQRSAPYGPQSLGYGLNHTPDQFYA